MLETELGSWGAGVWGNELGSRSGHQRHPSNDSGADDTHETARFQGLQRIGSRGSRVGCRLGQLGVATPSAISVTPRRCNPKGGCFFECSASAQDRKLVSRCVGSQSVQLEPGLDGCGALKKVEKDLHGCNIFSCRQRASDVCTKVLRTRDNNIFAPGLQNPAPGVWIWGDLRRGNKREKSREPGNRTRCKSGHGGVGHPTRLWLVGSGTWTKDGKGPDFSGQLRAARHSHLAPATATHVI